jgi:uncharacterized protein YndB with AHSA1/START domain
MPDHKGLLATAEASIDAPVSDVWGALIDPVLIKQYMFDTDVVTDWAEGGEIRWKGVWKGTPYEDKGTVLRVDEPHILAFTHFSPLTGEPDLPENYHTVTIELDEAGPSTEVTLTQDNNADEQARDHSEQNWALMLDSLRALLEARSSRR